MSGRYFGLDKRAFAFNSAILSLAFVVFRACICFSVKGGLPRIFELEVFFLGFALAFALDFALDFALGFALRFALGFALALVLAFGASLALDSALVLLGTVAPVLLTVAFLLGEVVVLPV